MKTMVKLAVLLATTLLLAGVAFAIPPCECYEINWTSLSEPGNSGIFYSEICFDYDNEGSVDYFCTPPGYSSPLYMFFDSMNKEAITYSNEYGQCIVYFKFHGDHNHVVTGIEAHYGYRAEFRGHQVDMENCNYKTPE